MNRAEAVIAEEFLANASPEKIYDWLKTQADLRASREASVENDSLNEKADTSEDLYRRLASRNESLVRLGLAQYCPTRDILLELYRTGNEAIRCAVLSNRWVIFDSHTLPSNEVRELLKTGTGTEIEALLMHPALWISGVLSDVLSGCDGAVSEERWFELVTVLQGNSALQENAERSDDVYGWGDNVFPFGSEQSKLVWYLLEKFPVEEKWADLLCTILTRIPYKRPNRLAIDALCKVRGKERLDPLDPESRLLSDSDCEAFTWELRALEIKWLERVLIRWTKEVQNEKQKWEEGSKAPFAWLRKTIAEKVATAALTGTLELKLRGNNRSKQKETTETDDERLFFLRSNWDFAVKHGYERAKLATETARAGRRDA